VGQKPAQRAPSLELVLADFRRSGRLTTSEIDKLKDAAIRDTQEIVAVAVENTLSTERQEKAQLRQIVSEISQYYELLVAELQDQVRRDPLTNLYNLRFLHDRLEQELSLIDFGRVSGLAKIDIRKFKFYNDHPGLGHHVGDEVIKAVADQLLRSTRQGREERPDLCVRRGGDEFILLMQDLHDPNEAYLVTQRFKNAMRETDFSQVLRPEETAIIMTEQPVEVDVGLAFLILTKTDAEFRLRKSEAKKIAREWIVTADMLMYEAKRFESDHAESAWLFLREDGSSGNFLQTLSDVNQADVHE